MKNVGDTHASVAISSACDGASPVVEHRGIQFGVLPPNKWLQLTSQLVTPFACAKVAPSCLAAEPVC